MSIETCVQCGRNIAADEAFTCLRCGDYPLCEDCICDSETSEGICLPCYDAECEGAEGDEEDSE